MIGKKVDEEIEDDVESGLKKRRRRGFESAFEELDGEMDALWLNDDEGPGGRPRCKLTYPFIVDEYAHGYYSIQSLGI